MIVADASAIVEMLLRTERGRVVEARLRRRRETIHAPALIDVEVANVLRRFVSRGQIVQAHGRAAIQAMAGFPIERFTHEALLSRIWALRENFTAYDAAYVALAEGLQAPLVTCDARLASAPGTRVVVELIV